VVSFTLRPFYPREGSPCTQWIGSWLGPRAGLVNQPTNQPTPWTRVLLEKLIATQLVKKLPKSSSQCSQEPVIGHYPDPVQGVTPHFCKVHFRFIVSFVSLFPTLSLLLSFSNQNFVCVFYSPHACYIPRHISSLLI